MDKTKSAPRGMIVTPHHLATESGLAILREGGTAVEAAIAAAATLAVVYPHMNSIGGDGFWLIMRPNAEPLVIEACGQSGSLATLDFFRDSDKIPQKGPKSAVTVAGALGGWKNALEYVSECGYQRFSTSRLLQDAIEYAENGFPVSQSLEKAIELYANEHMVDSTWKNVFMPHNRIPKAGERFYQTQLANTLKHLAKHGLNSFYEGPISDLIEDDMQSLGIPITKSDLIKFRPVRKTALRLSHSHGEIFNVPPPSQGLVSLIIHGILDKLKFNLNDDVEFIHATVEATKQAFLLRDKHVTDPKYMKTEPQMLLSDTEILKMMKKINPLKVATHEGVTSSSDTIWLGVMDKNGFSVSYIQSSYQEFGSGVILPKSGILWHNRGIAFKLDVDSLLSLKPGKKPLHTLNPAGAVLNDGRVMVYGSRGGDGQPQTQAAIFYRYVVKKMGLQASVTAPRWLFGRTVGESNNELKIEDRFPDNVIEGLMDRGHDVVVVSEFSDVVGHAGMLVRYPDGLIEGAFDPRSDGSVSGF